MQVLPTSRPPRILKALWIGVLCVMLQASQAACRGFDPRLPLHFLSKFARRVNGLARTPGYGGSFCPPISHHGLVRSASIFTVPVASWRCSDG